MKTLGMVEISLSSWNVPLDDMEWVGNWIGCYHGDLIGAAVLIPPMQRVRNGIVPPCILGRLHTLTCLG
jgi:hypothetical protein